MLKRGSIVAHAVERSREAELPFAVGLGRVGDRTRAFDQFADRVAVVSLVAKSEGAELEPPEQRQRNWCVRIEELSIVLVTRSQATVIASIIRPQSPIRYATRSVIAGYWRLTWKT